MKPSRLLSTLTALLATLFNNSGQPALVLDPTFKPPAASLDHSYTLVGTQSDGKILVYLYGVPIHGAVTSGLAWLNSDGSVNKTMPTAGGQSWRPRRIAA